MIIQIRGTSGSGKTWVMRRVIDSLGEGSGWKPEHVPGRKRPLWYSHMTRRIIVLGSYEATCGGCDNVGSAKAVYDLIQTVGPFGGTILCEGLLLSEDTKWSSQLPDLRVLFLNTPLDRCLAQIKSRRAEAGNDKELNPANTENRVAVIERARLKLSGLGIECRRATPEQAPAIIQRWVNG